MVTHGPSISTTRARVKSQILCCQLAMGTVCYYLCVCHCRVIISLVDNTFVSSPGALFYTPSGSDQCKCSTVVYSLLAGCSACQGGSWLKWSEYSRGCPNPGSVGLSIPVPPGTTIPQWTLFNVEGGDTWDVVESQKIASTASGRKDVQPGETISGHPCC
ncbi:hypothetical protein BGW80DRAFT_1269493 [Lactifluus volemus]|nr:hypothetical protein BGW80DRAFT_1269493 [Lactifluus volemus]